MNTVKGCNILMVPFIFLFSPHPLHYLLIGPFWKYSVYTFIIWFGMLYMLCCCCCDTLPHWWKFQIVNNALLSVSILLMLPDLFNAFLCSKPNFFVWCRWLECIIVASVCICFVLNCVYILVSLWDYYLVVFCIYL